MEREDRGGLKAPHLQGDELLELHVVGLHVGARHRHQLLQVVVLGGQGVTPGSGGHKNLMSENNWWASEGHLDEDGVGEVDGLQPEVARQEPWPEWGGQGGVARVGVARVGVARDHGLG